MSAAPAQAADTAADTAADADAAAGPAPLTLLRLQPDMRALSRWARTSGLRDAAADPGYAVHAATRAALGELAPKPFALRPRTTATELVGYCAATPAQLQRAAQLDLHDPEAAHALRLHDLLAKPMPLDWQTGERFSFEARVAPVVRSRSQAPGRYAEIDAACHPDYAGQGPEPADRARAYPAWLAQQLGRDGAATLEGFEALRFELTDMVRRTQRHSAADAPDAPPSGRRARRGLLPDLTVRGSLRVQDGPAFAALLARGLGRHRAFGFGCLLLAAPGAFHAMAPGR